MLIIKCPRARSATCARRPGTLPPSALHSIPDHRSISFFATSPKTTHSHTFHIFSTTNRRAGSADTPTSANSARTRTEPVARSGESPHQPTRKDLRPVLRPTTLQHVGCCKSITNQGTDVVLDGNLPASIFTHTGWGNRSGSNGCVGGRTSPAALCTLSCTHLTPSLRKGWVKCAQHQRRSNKSTSFFRSLFKHLYPPLPSLRRIRCRRPSSCLRTQSLPLRPKEMGWF